MKANTFNSLNNKQISNYKKHYNLKKYEFDEHTNNKTNVKNNINRPAQAISFSGSALLAGEKFITNGAANGLVGFVTKNEAAYNAIYSLIIAGVLKPGLVLAQTGFDDKDGQMIACKNFLQAFTGAFLALTLGGGFVKKIWNNMKNDIKLFKLDENRNLELVAADNEDLLEIAKSALKSKNTKFNQAKLFASYESGFAKVPAFIKGFFKKPPELELTDEQIKAKAKQMLEDFSQNRKSIFEKNSNFTKDLVENLEMLEISPSSAKRVIRNAKQTAIKSHLFDSYESMWKNSTGLITAITKARISSWLLPGVVAFLFAKRNLEAAKANELKNNNVSTLVNSKAFENTSSQFTNFTNNKQGKNIAFKGLLDGALNKATCVFENLSMSSFAEKTTRFFSKNSAKPSARWADIESIGLTMYWVGTTTASKKIDPDQKLGLNVHSVLVTAISSVCAFIVDSITDGVVDKAEEAYLKKLTPVANQAQEKLKSGETIEAIKEFIKNNCDKLYDSNNVVKELSKVETLQLDKEKLNQVVEGLAYNYGKGLSKFKSLTLFTLVVRFLVPVLTVKQSKKIKKILIDWNKKRAENKKAAQVK